MSELRANGELATNSLFRRLTSCAAYRDPLLTDPRLSLREELLRADPRLSVAAGGVEPDSHKYLSRLGSEPVIDAAPGLLLTEPRRSVTTPGEQLVSQRLCSRHGSE